jgi:predicted permease
VESVILGGIGAAAGLVVAAWASRALMAQISNQVDRVILDVSIDWHVAAFTAAITVATVVLFGLAPVFHGTRVRAIDVLIPRSMHPLGFRSAGSGLVVGQVALALMLLVVAGLFMRTFERLTTMPLGFDSQRVLLIKVDASRARVIPANRLRLYDQLVGAAAAVPGVASAAVSMVTPVGGGDMINVVDVPGAPPISGGERTVQLNYVTPGWFATYGTGIRAGRDIDDRDVADAPLVCVVNEAFARKFLRDANAVGATVGNAIRVPGQARSLKTVIGVVDDAVYRSLREAVRPTIYAPLAQLRFPPPNIRISVRSSGGPPSALAHGVVASLTAVDRDLALTVLPLSDQVSASLAQDRIVAQLSAFFGALALLLAAVGLYGVTAYGAVRRRTEIGVRMALGAQRGAVVKLMLRETISLTAVGMTLGLAGAAATTRYLEGMLFGVRPLDLPTFVVVALVFASVATLAAFVPARRATQVDPLVALRCE